MTAGAPALRQLMIAAAAVLLSITAAVAACSPYDPLCSKQGNEFPSSFGGAPPRDLKPVLQQTTPAQTAPAQNAQSQSWQGALARPAPVNTEAAQNGPGKAAGQCAAGKNDPGLPFSISFDGKPVEARGRGRADSQYCTDLALKRADVQVRYDGLANEPSLNVVASPNAVNRGGAVTFATHSNYDLRLARREMRIFDPQTSVLGQPLAVIPMQRSSVRWTAPLNSGDRVTYVLRVYDAQGRFDETAPKTLDLAQLRGGVEGPVDRAALLENNSRKVKNIPVGGGSILVSGRNVPAGHSVTVMGLPAEVDPQGNFAVRQILPSGPHDVEVAIADPKGEATVFSRSATVPDHDFFYVGLAELTVGAGKSSGPVALLAPDQADNFKDKAFADGRVAFYLKGKIKGETLITVSADTRDQPLRKLFSNFDSKDPTYLLRNLDPNRYYPVYGDDSTLVEDAPTRGKFYVRVERGDNNILWGNFKTGITGTDYVRYDRGLYGARVQAKTEGSTRFGERRGQFEAFAAEPGTLGVRDVFRGTGGSLFYLSRQNVTEGSERVTIETRDSVTGQVIASKTASPTIDYDISYLQGRIVLKTTLASTGQSDFIIQAGSLSAAQQYVVVNYEYAPGTQPTRDKAFGGRASFWLSDYFQVAVTGYDQTAKGEKLMIGGADVLLRLSLQTYVKMEIARSSGPGSGENVSFDGGFSFTNRVTTGAPAFARKIEAAADLAEIIPGSTGRVSGFWKQKDRDYSGPGELAVSRASREMGVRGQVKIDDNWAARVKLDGRVDDFRNYTAGEANVSYTFTPNWRLTGGVRVDDNKVNLLTASPQLNRAGRRVDTALRLDYASQRDWGVYAFGQLTAERTGQREANNRAGVGGYARVNERLVASAEVSGGNLGVGAKVGAEYKSDDERTTYANYALDPDRTDIIERGGLGLLTGGTRQRYNDNVSVFGEERVRTGGGFSGMTHAYGIEFTPLKDWKTGIRLETGKLYDPFAGTVQRTAVSPSLSYSRDGFSVNSRYEFRRDSTNSVYGALTTQNTRDTYLMNNLVTYKINSDWRVIGRLNGSYSNSTQGDFYRGNYLEGVAGAAYRPVANDRLNMLFKYTYFYDLPSPGQRAAVAGAGDYSQQSHVLSVDGIYDVNKWLSLGGKYAFRTGALRDNTLGGPWYRSTTQLLIGRADIHVVKQWDVTVELRRLSVSSAKDSQTGALVAVYRRINDNFKIGAGYNFTRFSDDLTNLSTRNRGFFVNAVGMF